MPDVSSSFAQLNERCAPATELRVIQCERHDVGVFAENGVHGAAEVANAFTVDDPHLQNTSLPAFGQVLRHQVLDLTRIERVKVEHPVNWYFHWLVVHAVIIVRPIKITIRKAKPADTAIIADFNLCMAWETEHRKLNRARVQRGVRALLTDPAKGTYYVAIVDGALAGQLLITSEWSAWRNGNFWWIQSVYVTTEFRRRGVFRALFNHVHNLARSRRGICGLRLYMHAENARARRAYEGLGMKHSDYEVFEMDFVLK